MLGCAVRIPPPGPLPTPSYPNLPDPASSGIEHVVVVTMKNRSTPLIPCCTGPSGACAPLPGDTTSPPRRSPGRLPCPGSMHRRGRIERRHCLARQPCATILQLQHSPGGNPGLRTAGGIPVPCSMPDLARTASRRALARQLCSLLHGRPAERNQREIPEPRNRLAQQVRDIISALRRSPE